MRRPRAENVAAGEAMIEERSDMWS